MMTMTDVLRLTQINGIGEARRTQGLDYIKVVPVPTTIAGACDLVLNYDKYGLTSYETSEALKMLK